MMKTWITAQTSRVRERDIERARYSYLQMYTVNAYIHMHPHTYIEDEHQIKSHTNTYTNSKIFILVRTCMHIVNATLLDKQTQQHFPYCVHLAGP